MATWTRNDIRQKIRELTGRLSVTDFSNAEIDTFLNRYVQYEFPAQVKLNRSYTYYQFYTVANQRLYDFPSNYTNFVPEVRIDELEASFFQNPDDFNGNTNENVTRFTQWSGDGSTTSFANTYTNNTPIQTHSVLVDDTVEVFSDDGLGNLTGNQGVKGTVDYSTGEISVNFNTAPADGQNIYVSFIQNTTGRPYMMLMFNNQFEFYPVPDRAYRVKMKAWTLELVKPAVTTDPNKELFTLPGDRPLLDEWGPAFAIGASRRIVESYGETSKYAELSVQLNEQLDLIMARTYVDLESTRARPMF